MSLDTFQVKCHAYLLSPFSVQSIDLNIFINQHSHGAYHLTEKYKTRIIK